MIQIVERIFSRYGELLLLAAGGSLLLFFGTLAAVPLILARLPEDFFILPPRTWKNRNFFDPVLFLFWFIIKNLLGILFLAMGLLMLFTPGQGLLTMVLGLVFLSFPGKRKLFRRVLSMNRIQRALNWFRKRTGKPPFLFHPHGV